MIVINDIPNAFALKDHHCKFYWSDNGSRWVFRDARFMELREFIGLDTHLIQFHTPFHTERVGSKEYLRHDPIIQFNNLADLVHFRLLL
ncbi:hypothetical protein D3C72_638380 [compost metagenome]